jgi:predicted metalloprotease with PDZ domain
MHFLWDESNQADCGVDFAFENDNVFVSKIHVDGQAYKSGLNACDEIIAIDNMRFSQKDVSDIPTLFEVDKVYTFHISRLGTLLKLDVMVGKKPRVLKEIIVVDKEKTQNLFS